MHRQGVKPPGLGVKPPGLGVKPLGRGVKPLGLGVKPLGLGVKPLGLGVKPRGLLASRRQLNAFSTSPRVYAKACAGASAWRRASLEHMSGGKRSALVAAHCKWGAANGGGGGSAVIRRRLADELPRGSRAYFPRVALHHPHLLVLIIGGMVA